MQALMKEKSKLRVTGLCEGNSPVTDEFPTQRASNAESVSIWWRHLITYQERLRASSSAGRVRWHLRASSRCQQDPWGPHQRRPASHCYVWTAPAGTSCDLHLNHKKPKPVILLHNEAVTESAISHIYMCTKTYNTFPSNKIHGANVSPCEPLHEFCYTDRETGECCCVVRNIGC